MLPQHKSAARESGSPPACVQDLTSLPAADRDAALSAAGVPAATVAEVQKMLLAMPHMHITQVRAFVEEEDDIKEGDLLTVHAWVAVTRPHHAALGGNAPTRGRTAGVQAFTPRFPHPVTEKWCAPAARAPPQRARCCPARPHPPHASVTRMSPPGMRISLASLCAKHSRIHHMLPVPAHALWQVRGTCRDLRWLCAPFRRLPRIPCSKCGCACSSESAHSAAKGHRRRAAASSRIDVRARARLSTMAARVQERIPDKPACRDAEHLGTPHAQLCRRGEGRCRKLQQPWLPVGACWRACAVWRFNIHSGGDQRRQRWYRGRYASPHPPPPPAPSLSLHLRQPPLLHTHHRHTDKQNSLPVPAPCRRGDAVTPGQRSRCAAVMRLAVQALRMATPRRSRWDSAWSSSSCCRRSASSN